MQQHYAFVPMALAALAALAPAQTLTVLVKDGDMPAGAGTVTAIDNLAVNDNGDTLVETSTTSGLSVMWRNVVPYLKEADALPAPAGATISSFDDIMINNLGESGWNLFLTGPATNADSGVYVDSTLVLQEGTLSTSPLFSPNTPYIGFFGVKWNDDRQMLVMASVDDPAIASTVDRALVKLRLDPAYAILSETVLAKEGDTVPGFGGETITDFETGPHGYALNQQGSVMAVAHLTGATTSDIAIVVDGNVLAREGDPSPIPGRNYEILSGRPVDLADNGHTIFRANLDGAATDDEVIVKDGVVIAQEGSGLPAIGSFLFTAFGSVARVDCGGHAFWFGDWDDPVTTQDTGLFVDDQLLVQEGVTTVGGIVIEFIASVQDTLTISPDGRYVAFEGRLAGGVDAAFLVDRGAGSCNTPATAFCLGDGTGAACPCGNTGSAGHGCGSSAFPGGAILSSSGIAGASAGTDTLVLTATDIPGPGLFFQSSGLAPSPVAFGDGQLCAAISIVRLGVVFPTAGVASYPGGLTPNPIHVQGGPIVAGDIKHYQCWYRSVPALCTTGSNYDLTQGLTLTWGP